MGMTPPDPVHFLPHLNYYDCSKVTDGASSLVLLSEKGVRESGLEPSELIEIIGIGEAEGDITQPPTDLTRLTTTEKAVQKALKMADLKIEEIGVLEVHDCFTISGLLSWRLGIPR